MRVLALAFIAAGLSACFSGPLGKPGSVPTDVKLLGTWHCVAVGEAESSDGMLTILRFDDWQYYAEWEDAKEFSRYRAYGTRLGDTTLLNAEELDGPFNPWPWAAVRASVGPDKRLELALVSPKALRSSDEKGMRHEIRARVYDPEIYDPFASCTAKDD